MKDAPVVEAGRNVLQDGLDRVATPKGANAMSSDAYLRKDHGTASPTSPYIDWGPDLPSHYPGGRARLLVANPTALYVVWESDLAAPARWRLELVVLGALLEAVDLPGGFMDTWLQAPAATQGEVHLFRDGERVAALPFSTPPAGPSDFAAEPEERWGAVEDGVFVDTSGIAGYALEDVSGPTSDNSSTLGSSSSR